MSQSISNYRFSNVFVNDSNRKAVEECLKNGGHVYKGSNSLRGRLKLNLFIGSLDYRCEKCGVRLPPPW